MKIISIQVTQQDMVICPNCNKLVAAYVDACEPAPHCAGCGISFREYQTECCGVKTWRGNCIMCEAEEIFAGFEALAQKKEGAAVTASL